jgi:hypothetical protein
MILESKAVAIVSEAAHYSKIRILDIPANIGLEARAFALEHFHPYFHPFIFASKSRRLRLYF